MTHRTGAPSVSPAGPPVQDVVAAGAGAPAEAGPTVADRLRTTAIVGVELGLILVIVRSFEVAAQNHFFPVLCLAVGGFLVHAWLPVRVRPALFPLVSVAGVLFFLGWPNGAW